MSLFLPVDVGNAAFSDSESARFDDVDELADDEDVEAPLLPPLDLEDEVGFSPETSLSFEGGLSVAEVASVAGAIISPSK